MASDKIIIYSVLGIAAAAAAGYAFKQFKGDGLDDTSSGSYVASETGGAFFDSTGNASVDKRFIRDTGRTDRTETRQGERTDRTEARQSGRTSRTIQRQETIREIIGTAGEIFKPKTKSSSTPAEENNFTPVSGGAARVTPQGVTISTTTPIQAQSKLRKTLNTVARVVAPLPTAFISRLRN